MGFGIDLYQRKRPKVSFNSEVGLYQEIKMSNENFTYAYRVEDKNGLMITDESKVYQQVEYFYLVVENGEWNKKFQYILPNKRCLDLPHSKEKEKAFNISLESWYCIDFDNLTMGGNWDGNFVYGIIVYTKQCKSETGRKCSSREEIKSFISPDHQPSQIFYSDLSLEVYPSMDDFKPPPKQIWLTATKPCTWACLSVKSRPSNIPVSSMMSAGFSMISKKKQSSQQTPSSPISHLRTHGTKTSYSVNSSTSAENLKVIIEVTPKSKKSLQPSEASLNSSMLL
jgi:hypothetical protein